MNGEYACRGQGIEQRGRDLHTVAITVIKEMKVREGEGEKGEEGE